MWVVIPFASKRPRRAKRAPRQRKPLRVRTRVFWYWREPLSTQKSIAWRDAGAGADALVDRYGWNELGRIININCFTHEPSIKSSLKFLRKTPWAREKVEALYVRSLKLAE